MSGSIQNPKSVMKKKKAGTLSLKSTMNSSVSNIKVQNSGVKSPNKSEMIKSESKYNDSDEGSDRSSDTASDSASDEGREGYIKGGYHRVNIGDVFNSKYLVLDKLGWGHFSTVWLAYDLKSKSSSISSSSTLPSTVSISPQYVALKIQKSADHYRDAAYDEIELLRSISATCESDLVKTEYGTDYNSPVVKFYDSFVHSGYTGLHVCMAFEVLGENLLSVIRRYNYRGIPIPIVKDIARKVLEGLDFLHRHCSIIHTDLKPENILVVHSNVDSILGNERYNELIQFATQPRGQFTNDSSLPTQPKLKPSKIPIVSKKNTGTTSNTNHEHHNHNHDKDKDKDNQSEVKKLIDLVESELNISSNASVDTMLTAEEKKKLKKKLKKKKQLEKKKDSNSSTSSIPVSPNSNNHSNNNSNNNSINSSNHNSRNSHHPHHHRAPSRSKKDDIGIGVGVEDDMKLMIQKENRIQESNHADTHIHTLIKEQIIDPDKILSSDTIQTESQDQDQGLVTQSTNGKESDTEEDKDQYQDNLGMNTKPGTTSVLLYSSLVTRGRAESDMRTKHHRMDSILSHVSFQSYLQNNFSVYLNFNPIVSNKDVSIVSNVNNISNDHNISNSDSNEVNNNNSNDNSNIHGIDTTTVVSKPTLRVLSSDLWLEPDEHHYAVIPFIISYQKLNQAIQKYSLHPKTTVVAESPKTIQNVWYLNLAEENNVTMFCIRKRSDQTIQFTSLLSKTILHSSDNHPNSPHKNNISQNNKTTKNLSQYNTSEEPILWEIIHHSLSTKQILLVLESILVSVRFLCIYDLPTPFIAPPIPSDTIIALSSQAELIGHLSKLCIYPVFHSLENTISPISNLSDNLGMGRDSFGGRDFHERDTREESISYPKLKHKGYLIGYDFLLLDSIDNIIVDNTINNTTTNKDDVHSIQSQCRPLSDRIEFFMTSYDDMMDSLYLDSMSYIQLNHTITSITENDVTNNDEGDVMDVINDSKEDILLNPSDYDDLLLDINDEIPLDTKDIEIATESNKSDQNNQSITTVITLSNTSNASNASNPSSASNASNLLKEKKHKYTRSELDEKYAHINVKIVDLGNACWRHKHFTEDIQTREYRSPEVILGSKYDISTDIWSIGCILFELLTGDVLFDPQKGKLWNEDEDHLALMLEVIGMPRLSKSDIGIYQSTSKYYSEFFTRKGELKNIQKLKVWPIHEVLHEKYHFTMIEAKEISDFLMCMLQINPGKRATARECMLHPWLQTTD